ncbi:hypothetical protein BIW11_09030 [Tropilaelaps mercedesae]|uniref:Uncharacterized protein n=1 Tax=Tropilaelaps mercedesae TaxID=418985 RepID=A0A1V9XLV2_9ACAR|nr:hypothetical protein BIW11_09030 [Tropilaelaps mercedesae]
MIENLILVIVMGSNLFNIDKTLFSHACSHLKY